MNIWDYFLELDKLQLEKLETLKPYFPFLLMLFALGMILDFFKNNRK